MAVKMVLIVFIRNILDLEQHLKDRDDDCKREKCENCGQNIENDIQREIVLVGRYKAA
jgi:hypothetical protein